ncbi:putative zinc protease pqqL [Morus notabilis]|uniref:Putative zinc protease pqqL n=1 Tax=Morus notabilis TaxID=981085 RepID=W9RN51_9ROSA|nr:putative zinc protease pqqL [Morus notabilis]
MQDNLEGFLSSELPSHPNLTRGQLENGLRYCILPHKRLPNRFEAHLEVHVGSMHEEEDEQGIAHMTEHVIESEKFSELFYVGATYGAYTYFYGTVYHIKSQVTFEHIGLLPHVLDALNEQAFKPKIRASYLEKERNVVLSELQMWNTIDFRIEGKLCQLLHSENKLNKRYNVLGLEEQIKNWSVAQIKKFYKRWYFLGNATLYIVGDINDVSKTIVAIQVPVNKFQTYGDLRNFVMKQIYLSALQFRINAKYKSSNSSATLIELSHFDKYCTGCARTLLGTTSEPKDWKTAIKVAFHEVQRLKELGISYDEFTLHKDVILNDSANFIAVLDDDSSSDIIKLIMRNDALGRATMEVREAHKVLAAVATTITLDEIETPTELISQSQLQELWLERQPSFVPLTNSNQDVKKLHDKRTNIIHRRLSNGISIIYKMSKNEGHESVIRVIIGAGRAHESSDLKGAIALGVQTLCEGGCVGNFSNEQCTEEFITVEVSFTSRDNGMQAAFQLLHMLLEQSIWLEDAFDRARQLLLSNFQSNLKSLEQSTARKLMLAMLEDERFIEPTQKSLKNLTLQSVKDASLNKFIGNNIEVSIVGDFSEEDIESCIINYLGTIKATENFKNGPHQYEPIMCSASPSHLQSRVFLKDTEERTYACVAGLAPNIWGFNIDGKHYLESKLIVGENWISNLHRHPFFFLITMEFLTELIDTRLVEAVNGSYLAYQAKLDVHLCHKLNLGWYVISISSTPSKVHKTVDACKKVVKDFRSVRFSSDDLEEVRECMLKRHEEEMMSNSYWLKLLCLLQASYVSRKDISCLGDLASLYKAVTMEDIYLAYDHLKISEDSIYSCIGIAR